jgi:hypothetical protein
VQWRIVFLSLNKLFNICSHNMRFVQSSEKKIISSKELQWLLFMTVTARVYRTLWTEYLNMIQFNLFLQIRKGLGSILGQSKWNLWHWYRFISEYFSFLCQYHTTIATLSSSSACCSYQDNKWNKTGNIKKVSFLENRRELIRKGFHFFLL